MLRGLEALEEVLAGRYALERELGRGGMATIYLARDLRHPRRVAIKVLRPEVATGIALDRFRSEIDIAAALTHPNILPVFDSGGAGERLYCVMPYVEGESLRARLQRERQLPVDQALRIAREVADALAYAHRRNVVHRDIKPENILLVEGHAVVADFGIARAIANAEARRTGTGVAIGTPLYMSPEQAGGGDVDERSDIYSLGCVVYEMLAGAPPHAGGTPEQMLARKLAAAPRPLAAARPDLPRGLDAAVAKALDPEPENRYRTASDFAQALGRPSRVVHAPAWVAARRRWGGVAALAIVLLAGAGYAAITGRERRIVGDDGRIGVAVFPFRPSMQQAAQWSEAIPDLLATTLDGTPGVRVADPWALWRTLRADPRAAAHSPDPEEAARIAHRARAGCFILGSIVQLEGNLELTIHIYRRGADVWQTFSIAGTPDSIAALVRHASVEIIRRLSMGAPSLQPEPEGPVLTQSPEALKAWLSAREFQRRGELDSAEAAITRAVSLDSTFALALVDAVAIKSWVQFQRGEPYAGLRELAERAVRLGDSLPERPRLRSQAMLAAINTDGERAAGALEHILALDSLDFDAWGLLAYVRTAYGWEYGATEADAISAAEHAVRLDSTDVPSLFRRAVLAAATNDTDDVDRQIARLRRSDTTVSLARGALRAIEAVRADDARFARMLDQLASAPIPEWITVFRLLRAYRPDRTEAFVERTRSVASAVALRVATGALVQLYSAEGRWRSLDSLRRAGAFAQIPGFDRVTDRELAAAAVAGVGDEQLVRAAVVRLDDVPPERAPAFFTTRLVWHDGWLVGAYHAMYGDTTLARRWYAAIGKLPRGGHPREYAAALQEDIAARLAGRAGDRSSALAHARRALELWDVHTENQLELMPEPAMRFHLAVLWRSAGQPDSAAALFRSLTMPTTWMGYYTARAALELGELREAGGDRASAQHYYLTALRLWERGDSVVAPYRDRARRGLGGGH